MAISMGKMITGSRDLFVGTMLVDFGPLGDRLGVGVLHTFDAVPSQRTALPWDLRPESPSFGLPLLGVLKSCCL